MSQETNSQLTLSRRSALVRVGCSLEFHATMKLHASKVELKTLHITFIQCIGRRLTRHATNLSSTQSMANTYGKRPYTPIYFHHHQEEHQGGLREEGTNMMMIREKIQQLLAGKGCKINAQCVVNLATKNPHTQLHRNNQHHPNLHYPNLYHPNLHHPKHNQLQHFKLDYH